MEGKKGGKGQQQQERRSSGVIEESIWRGDTMKEDWETSTERETRIQEECGKQGTTYYPEDDWSMAERLAEDEARALAKAAIRKTISGTCTHAKTAIWTTGGGRNDRLE